MNVEIVIKYRKLIAALLLAENQQGCDDFPLASVLPQPSDRQDLARLIEEYNPEWIYEPTQDYKIESKRILESFFASVLSNNHISN